MRRSDPASFIKHPVLDQMARKLSEALEEIAGSNSGSIVSCIHGRLAYYEGEDVGERWLLQAGVAQKEDKFT